MDRSYTLYGQLVDIIQQEVKFLKHYRGRVIDNNDVLLKGRVLVLVDELGWSTPDVAAWCSPRQLHRMTVPAIGEYVEIYFMNGDRDQPVYLEMANDIINQIPQNFDGKPSTHIIFESPLLRKYIKYDELTGQYTFDFTLLKLGATSTEFAVLGTQLNIYLTALIGSINTLLASKLDGSGTAGTLTPPTGILSAKVTLE